MTTPATPTEASVRLTEPSHGCVPDTSHVCRVCRVCLRAALSAGDVAEMMVAQGQLLSALAGSILELSGENCLAPTSLSTLRGASDPLQLLTRWLLLGWVDLLAETYKCGSIVRGNSPPPLR